MLCNKCMIVMGTGTEYYLKKDKNDKGYKRYHKCKKCGDKIYTKEVSFQECINNAINKNRNK